MKMSGKVAVVTGAASGLGLETCRTLARAGARIIALDLSTGGLEALQEELGKTCVTHLDRKSVV